MTLQDYIHQCCQPTLTPSQKTYKTISLADRDRIASTLGVSKKAVEIAALEAGVVPRRYLRNMGSLGIPGQLKLLQAKALLVGVGGLGGTIAQLLARMGLGALIIADGDSFSEDNLNRQAFAMEKNVGVSKVQVAQEEILKINGVTEIETFQGFVTERELPLLLKDVSLAIDALDNIPSRFLLEKACKGKGIPLVHGSVAGFCGQVTVIYPEDIGFRALYGNADQLPEKGIEVELGNLAGIVSAVASLEVQESIKVITGLGRPLRNRLLFLDSMSGIAEVIVFK